MSLTYEEKKKAEANIFRPYTHAEIEVITNLLDIDERRILKNWDPLVRDDERYWNNKDRSMGDIVKSLYIKGILMAGGSGEYLFLTPLGLKIVQKLHGNCINNKNIYLNPDKGFFYKIKRYFRILGHCCWLLKQGW